MPEDIKEIQALLELIPALKEQFPIERNPNSCGPLIYTGVVQSDIIAEITPLVEKYFGLAFKPAGQGTFFKNITDNFAKQVGGMRKEQTFFKNDLSADLILYCAFWPWGSNPVKTSVRIELLCSTESLSQKMAGALTGCFQP